MARCTHYMVIISLFFLFYYLEVSLAYTQGDQGGPSPVLWNKGFAYIDWDSSAKKYILLKDIEKVVYF